jgi:hypothetical protein
MNEELLTTVEREVLRWDGVFKKRDENGPDRTGVTGYRYGDPESGGPEIGHVHDDGHTDFSFSEEVRDELIRSGQAIHHPAFPDSRTMVSYRIQSPEDLPKVLELFRTNYDLAKAGAE